jgi:hypothetical protein
MLRKTLRRKRECPVGMSGDGDREYAVADRADGDVLRHDVPPIVNARRQLAAGGG